MLLHLIVLVIQSYNAVRGESITKWEESSDCNDILHVLYEDKCTSVCDPINKQPLFCNLSSALKFDCSNYEYGVVASSTGYWYDNNLKHYAVDCPVEYCQSYYENSSASHPDRNQQCHHNCTGIICGECNYPNIVLFDTTGCVSKSSYLLNGLSGWVLLFSTILGYWSVLVVVIIIIFYFLLRFKIQIGYAYCIFFYYSILEHVVTSTQNTHFYQLYLQNHCGSEPYQRYSDLLGTKSRILVSLASIGNLKPPFIQYMGLCLHTEVIDHVFFAYIHPLLVLSLMAIVIIISKWSNRVAHIIQKHSFVCSFYFHTIPFLTRQYNC